MIASTSVCFCSCRAHTKAICNKGFSGNSSILHHSNFGVGGQESSPQSLTAYSLSRYEQREQTEPQQSRANLWQVTKEKRAVGRGKEMLFIAGENRQ